MKSIRKQLKPISSFMAFLVLFVSCEQYGDGVETPVESKLSGEEIFKSIFFGTGEFSNRTILLSQISESVNKLNSEQKNEYLSNIDVLTKAINVNNPKFFSSFEQSIKSNNHHYVKSAIEKGSIEIKNNLPSIVPNFENVITNLEDRIQSETMNFDTAEDVKEFAQEFKKSEYDILLKQNMIEGDQAACTLFLACALAVALYAVVAVHNTAAVAANVYLVFALWGPSLDKHKGGGEVGSPPDREDHEILSEEMLIQEIASIEW